MSEQRKVDMRDEGRTVLVVEDNPQAAKLLSLHLSRAGYRVAVAGGGAEALRLALEQRPVAITLDLMLPDQDGWEVLERLKASPLTRDIPVVIISVLDRQPLGFRLGAAEFLVKPIDRAALLHALRCALARDAAPPRRILLVHTNPAELRALALSMMEHNYEVNEALGSEEAACLARRLHPDLVVVDLLTGGIDTAALVSALKADVETARIPILALTVRLPPGQSDDDSVHFILIRDEDIEQPLLAAITLLLSEQPKE
jgi:CheY-like chemotaxis protein